MKKFMCLSFLVVLASVFLLSTMPVEGAKGVLPDIALIVASSPPSTDLETNSEVTGENDRTADSKIDEAEDDIQEAAIQPDDAAQDDQDSAQNQEEYLQALIDSEIAAITREGNLLAISLKGDVTFDTGSTVVMPGLYSEIQKIADAMMKYPETLATIEGHTDSVGAASYNKNLSVLRALSVKNHLVEGGVDSSRIETIGFGESNPVASNDNEIGRMRNRRVEIKIDLNNDGTLY
jgi:outer membrane protein OmpA-like peptidoglycan-associated protein